MTTNAPRRITLKDFDSFPDKAPSPPPPKKVVTELQVNVSSPQLEHLMSILESKDQRITELEAKNTFLKECIQGFMFEAQPWIDCGGAQYNSDLADCVVRRLEIPLGEL